ncbi:MAG TPA: fibronectin type III domain-containing protein, partial [bacterium]|nr:fibronectin type III domain-containing protein [bacterium]
LFGWTYPEDAQVRTIRPQWYSKYNSSLQEPDAFIWDTRANNTNEISVAPADRHDFGKWRDVIDFYFGTYSALGSPTNEQDAYWNHDLIVDEVVEYFTYYSKYWLDQTGFNPNNPSESYKGIDGFRCDFAQGLPPAMWEYIINKTRSYKWDFIFMAESLDGGAVSRRAARQFDIINDNWVFSTENLWTAPEWKQAVEQRRTDYGNALILRNTVTHDHQPPEDPWVNAIRTAMEVTLDGVPLVFQGAELGYCKQWGFKHWTYEWGRYIVNFKVYNDMTNLWNNPVPGLKEFYQKILKAREMSPALKSQNQWFLSQVGGGEHQKIFAVAKYEKSAAEGGNPANSDVVLCFVNYDRNNGNSGTFSLTNVPLGIISNHRYNVCNIASSNPQQYLWKDGQGNLANKLGSEILANGIYVGFSGDVTTDGFIAQFLKLVDMDAGVDNQPPVFAGLTSCSATGEYGKISLSWSAASDTSTPITYYIYYTSDQNAQQTKSYIDSTPDFITTSTSYIVSNLTNGTRYYFVVRAKDALNNIDNNLVEKSAIPTGTINDTTPPIITNITQIPVYPKATDTVTIRVIAQDMLSGINSVVIKYTTNNWATYIQDTMYILSGDT